MSGADLGNLTPGRAVESIMGPEPGDGELPVIHVPGKRGVSAMHIPREFGPMAAIPYVAVRFEDGRVAMYPCHQLVEIVLAPEEAAEVSP